MTLYYRSLNCLSKQKELLADERKLTFATKATFINYFAPHLKNSLLVWKMFVFNGLKLLSNLIQKLSALFSPHLKGILSVVLLEISINGTAEYLQISVFPGVSRYS